jgi:nucleotide-binding universal stress UspA family protein
MVWFQKKSVLIPIDFSEESFDALDIGLQLVQDVSQVTVIHVLQDLSPMEAGEVWGVIDPQTRLENVTKALRERLKGDEYARVRIEVLLGDPAHGIANYAQQEKVELIVIPSHGRTGLTRLLIGSTAERVVRLAHCPVLVLRK